MQTREERIERNWGRIGRITGFRRVPPPLRELIDEEVVAEIPEKKDDPEEVELVEVAGIFARRLEAGKWAARQGAGGETRPAESSPDRPSKKAEVNPPRPLVRGLPFAPELEDRREVFALGLAHAAAGDEEVLWFRREVLGDRLLSADEATRFLASPALQMFARHDLVRWGVPLLEHRAEIVDEWERIERPASHQGVRVRRVEPIDPDGWVRQGDPWGWFRKVHVHIDPPGVTKEMWYQSPPYIGLYDPKAIEAPDQVAPASVLDDLRRIAWRLEERCHWSEKEATRFVLTGDTPPVQPLQARLEPVALGAYSYAFLHLRIAPWVPAPTVERAYQNLQQSLTKPVYRERFRPLDNKGLEVFRFVLSRTEPSGRRPSWPKLCDAWNEEHPEERYTSHVTMWKAFDRIQSAVFMPETGPGDASSDNKHEQNEEPDE
jgi:hypothetical protein